MAAGELSKNKFLLFCFLFPLLFLFAGCERRENIKKVDLSKTEEIKGRSQEPARIRIGLIPEQDIRKMAARYEPLAEYLSKKLERKVVLVYMDSYGEVCDKFIYKQLDAAFFGSFSYALTHRKAGVEPIARPDYEGVSTYRGLILVKENSNIKNIKDLKDKRLGLVHQATYAGYLYPMRYFKEHGIKNLEGYFSEIKFMGSHDNAIFALLRNEIDAACPKDLVFQRVIKENPDLEKKLIVLAVSEPVPSNALCVSKDFEPVLKDKLKQVLLNLHRDPQAISVLKSLGDADRFVETSDQDYQFLYDTIKVLGIDLNIYAYYDRFDMGFDRLETVK
jgi:phosphonate transport system substrate-binding protein